MKDTTFENFLQEKHSEQYVGTDDAMVDDFSDWLVGLDTDEWIAYGDLWGAIRNKDGYQEAVDTYHAASVNVKHPANQSQHAKD